jgi:hypothetical protein
MNIGPVGRIAAACIAAIAWIGLVIQCAALYGQNSSVLLTLWILSAFFTITTNLLVAVVFTGLAANRTVLRADWIVGGTMLSILLVGVIYALLLHGLTELSGGGVVANVLLHMVTPAIVLLFWIFLARKGGLAWHHPLLWAVYPLVYLAYALARGAATGKYAYPFINVNELGWGRTMLNAAAIAVAFLLCSFAVVWIDRRLASRSAA